MIWRHATGTISLDRPRILGIVNVTPDSFSDGGQLRTVDDARRHVDRLVAQGADVIDIGGESTRPGAEPVSVADELERVVPIIAAVSKDHPTVPISIDTVKASVAREAIGAGASIINDVSGLRIDPEMPRVCGDSGAGVVLMHSRGDVADMASFAHATYGDDVVGDILAEVVAQVDVAISSGISRDRLALDPGIGFAKRGEDSLRVLAELRRFVALGFPVVVGVSRKRFIGEITGANEPSARVAGTVGANVAALERGARVFRVHDVKANRDALDVAWAIGQIAP